MPITYKKLFALLEERNISLYRLKADKIIGTATLDKIRKGGGHIDTRSIAAICEYLGVQPGDIMEYEPEQKSAE
ncbi:MAG: helix-turn-helix transcriptional regulator [Clostridia bacterium]|nr:helix-turn-helix transcriptional regulator [Clostridia bacterium]